jgi:chromosome segregation ATPase
LNDANDTALKMQEEMECLRRERDLATAKCDALQEDCDGVKSNHDILQQSYNESCVKMALLETKVEESKSQLEEARSQVVEAQLLKEKALDEMKVEMSKDTNALQEKNETMVASVKAREMEICRMMSVDLESVDFGDGSSILNAVRSKVEEYQHDANTTNEIQNELERLKAELMQSKTDLGVSIFVVCCHCVNCVVWCQLNNRVFYVQTVRIGKRRNKRQRYE